MIKVRISNWGGQMWRTVMWTSHDPASYIYALKSIARTQEGALIRNNKNLYGNRADAELLDMY